MLPLEHARSLLNNHQVVAIPTETVYGLAAKITSDQALRQIFAIKMRPFFDPLIVHVSSISEAQTVVAEWPQSAQTLAQQFWPGPLTLVLPKNPSVSDLITSGLKTVAVRCPRHESTIELLRTVGPLAAPSANRFGKTSPSTAQHVRDEFGDQVFILDGGPCEGGIESTVVEVTSSELAILRPGLVTPSQIQRCSGLPVTVKHSAQSPGHLPHHYQPDVPLVLFDATEAPLELERITIELKKIATERNQNSQIYLEVVLPESPEIAARSLYATLRSTSEKKPALLFVVKKANQQSDLWQAIWDRLSRASSFQIKASSKVFCE